MIKTLSLVLLLILLPGKTSVYSAEIFLEMSRSGFRKIPLMILPFQEGSGKKVAASIVENVFRADLERSLFFDLIETSDIGFTPTSNGVPDAQAMAKASKAGVQALVWAKLLVNEKEWVLESYAYETSSREEVVSILIFGKKGSIRNMARRFLDILTLHFTGEKGVAQTQIAYISDLSGNKELYVMYYDGANKRRLTKDHSILLSAKSKKFISKVLPPQASPRPHPPAQMPVVAQEDPDRLEEWWKKLSEALKVAKIKPSATPEEEIGMPESPTQPPETSGSAVESTGDVATESNAEDSVQGGASEMASLDPAHQKSRLGSTGGASTGSTNFAFPGYLQRIDNKIRWQWAPPSITPEEDSLVVRFDIHKNGSINKMSVVVEESSGNTYFDQSALRAVYAAQPFPPLPEAYRDQTLTVYMHFIVREAS